MKLLTNIIFAWISVALTLLLCVIYILRKYNDKESVVIKKCNKFLRKYHKILGITLIFIGFIHGYFSSIDVLSPNKGTISWILSILLGLSFYLRNKIKINKSWIYYHRILTVVFLIMIVIHIVEVGGFVGFEAVYESIKKDLNPKEHIETNKNPSDIAENIDDLIDCGNVYKDGTFIGEADGYGPGLTVEVIIEKNLIKSIEIIKHNENKKRFYAEPIEVIPGRILETQSTLVDAVSGSTMTSYGIMNAVNDALNKALISGELINIENP